MGSYHRVLSIFDRPVHDKNKECECDIHPWEVLINNERWTGKTRLIGFVDVFFLICYSTHDRFERGIIVYKEDDAIRNILDAANRTADQLNLEVQNKREVDDKDKAPKYFQFVDEPGNLDYIITSMGHKVDLCAEYSAEDVQKYEIKLRRPRDSSLRGPIYRGITQHSVPDLMHDVVRLGVVSNAEMTSHLITEFASGSHTEDTVRKWMTAISGGAKADHTAIA
ncbi:hypothetical protein SLS57_008958 [Botryosphaeria dothidea]